MKNFLKYIVITLGLLIIILFVVMVFAISNKYSKKIQSNQNIDLNPRIKLEENIIDFYIEDSKLYILVESEKDNTQLIQIYDIYTGNKLNRIQLK